MLFGIHKRKKREEILFPLFGGEKIVFTLSTSKSVLCLNMRKYVKMSFFLSPIKYLMHENINIGLSFSPFFQYKFSLQIRKPGTLLEFMTQYVNNILFLYIVMHYFSENSRSYKYIKEKKMKGKIYETIHETQIWE